MRPSYLILHGLLSTALLIACGKTDELTTTDASETGGSSGTTGDDPTTEPGTASNTTGESCVPGASVECACPSGETGAQVCAADGKSFGMCVCEGGGSNSNSDSDSTSPTIQTTDPTTTGDGTTSGDNTTGDGTTSGDNTTGDNTTGDVLCEDPGPEPNEQEGDAVELDDQGCQGDDGNLGGVLAGDADVDWFMYTATDGQGCGFENPFMVHTLTASEPVRLCVFAECNEGEAMFQCPMMMPPIESPENRPGCCSDDGALTFQFNCMGSPNETADVFVRLDQAPANACVEYSVVYSFGPN